MQAARAEGVQSIDVGCMQVNLMYRPEAFASLNQAFDPKTNAVYAADFLNRLFIKTGNWSKAIAAYHSQTHGANGDYAQRVIASWTLAARYGADDKDRLVGRSRAPGLFGLSGGTDDDENGLSRYLHNYTTGSGCACAQDEADRRGCARWGSNRPFPGMTSILEFVILRRCGKAHSKVGGCRLAHRVDIWRASRLRDNVIVDPNDPAILKQRSVRGAAATFIGQGLRFFLQLASQVIPCEVVAASRVRPGGDDRARS